MIRLTPLLVLALAIAPAAAQQKSGGSPAAKGHDSDAPIDISSESGEVQDRAGRAIWQGKVHAVQGDMTIDSARMTASYTHATQPGQDPEIHRIDASGGVTVVNPTERATGDFGIYDLDRKLITLIGHVVLTRGTNVVTGARLVTDLNSGRSVMDGNSVGGGGSGTASSGRVTGHFTVPKKTQPATTTPAAGATPPK